MEDESSTLVTFLLRSEDFLLVLCTMCMCNFHQKKEVFIQVLRGGTVAAVLGNFKQTEHPV